MTDSVPKNERTDAQDVATAEPPPSAVATAEGTTTHVPIRVQVPAFEGPLDLLLHLIQQDEIEISEIGPSSNKRRVTSALVVVALAATGVFLGTRSKLPARRVPRVRA